MGLQIGIVGLPNVGKSTLFNALTNNNVLAANYPFATIDPNTGIVPVPDHRLDRLADLFRPKSKVPATVTFVDIAGLVKGAAEGAGLGNQFLSHIRSTDAICQVVRAFKDDNVTHVDNKIDPRSDIETINSELILADIAVVDRKIEQKDERLILRNVRDQLDAGKLAGSFLTPEELEEVRDLQLLTAKPFIIVFNLSEEQLSDVSYQTELKSIVDPCPTVFVSAKLESELAGLDETESQELLKEYGQAESGLGQLAKSGYEALGLISFFTAGEPEVRAWTIKNGSTAPQAAGVIHTDFEKGFIRAETIHWQELVDSGGWTEARAKGKVRSEGKDYLVKDGDTVLFRFNV